MGQSSSTSSPSSPTPTSSSSSFSFPISTSLPTSTSSPSSPSHLSHRRLLLYLLFQSIAVAEEGNEKENKSQNNNNNNDNADCDIESVCYTHLSRPSLLHWVSHHPYLRNDQSPLSPHLLTVLSLLDHDEDNVVSLTEFYSAFRCMKEDEVVLLIGNLLKVTMGRKRINDKLGVEDNKKEITASDNEQKDSNNRFDNAFITSPPSSPDDITLHFLLDILFSSLSDPIDNTNMISSRDINEMESNGQIFQQYEGKMKEIIGEMRELLGRKEIERDKNNNISVSSATRRMFGLSRNEFHSIFTRHIDLDSLQSLFLHLLSRSTNMNNHDPHPITPQQPGDDGTKDSSNDKCSKKDVNINSKDGKDGMGMDKEIESKTKEKEMSRGERLEEVAKEVFHHESQGMNLIRGKMSYIDDGIIDNDDSPPLFRFITFGQIMIQHDIRPYPRGQSTLSSMSQLLREGDIVFSELETSIQIPKEGKGSDDDKEKESSPIHHDNAVFQHSAPPSVLDCLTPLSIHLLSCSNNHAGDLGAEGIETIMREVEKRGMVHGGIGRNLEEAAEVKFLDVEVEVEGETPTTLRLSLSSFASKVPLGTDATPDRPGVHPLSMSDIPRSILADGDVRRILHSLSVARRHSSVVIAYHHNHYWEKGVAVNISVNTTAAWRQQWARKCIDAGATMYISHGEPRLGGMEIYKGCPVLFGLGNFMFQTKTEPGFYGHEVWEGVMVVVEYWDGEDGKGKGKGKGGRRNCKRTQWGIGNVNVNSIHGVKVSMNNNANDPLLPSPPPPPSSTYSIQLIPLILNDVGDDDPPTPLSPTRGLPSVANRETAIRILDRVNLMSESLEWGGRVEIEEREGRVVGWLLPREGKGKEKGD